MEPVHVADASDPRLDDYRALHGRGDRIGPVVVEGVTPIGRLLTSPLTVRSLLLTEKSLARLAPELGHVTAPVYVLGQEQMNEVVGFNIHRGAVAAAEPPANPNLAEVAATARRLVVLEGCNDHENLGAIARSARGLGIDALVLDPTCADPFARRAVRVSMGEVLHLPVVRCDTWPQPLGTLADAGFETWALTPSADADVRDLGAPERLALLAGTEGPGLTDVALEAATRRVGITMRNGVDSLNVGHALSIAMAVTAR